MVDFEIQSIENDLKNKLTIPIEPHSKEVKIMGAYVIPEFGFLAMGILSIGLFSTLFLARSKLSMI